MKLTITTKDNKPVVTDETGAVLDWIDLVVLESTPGFKPTIYLGSSQFEGTITLGTASPLVRASNALPAYPNQPPIDTPA